MDGLLSCCCWILTAEILSLGKHQKLLESKFMTVASQNNTFLTSDGNYQEIHFKQLLQWDDSSFVKLRVTQAGP